MRLPAACSTGIWSRVSALLLPVAFFVSARYVRRMKRRCFNFAFVLSLFLAVTAFAENTAVIPAPRTFPTNWMSSHEAFLRQAKPGGIDLLFLGDSITAGWLWDKSGLNVWNKY